MTATAASSRCIRDVVLGIDHHQFEEILDACTRTRNGYTLDTDLDADDWKRVVVALQGAASRKRPASRSRRTRMSSCGARSARCSVPG